MSHHRHHELEHTPEAIRARLTQNSQPYFKDAIFGAIDGTVTTFAVVSTVAGAGLSSGIVIVMGLANLLADGFSMAAGNFTGIRAENQAAQRYRREEEEEIEKHPDGEREEVRQIFSRKGFEGEMLEKVVEVITADKNRWVDTMIQEEHGLSLTPQSAIKAALAIFIAFLAVGSIPLLSYFGKLLGLQIEDPFLISCLLTGCAFFAIGAFKSRFVDQHWILGGFETLAIGAGAAAMAYGLGFLLSPYLPQI